MLLQDSKATERCSTGIRGEKKSAEMMVPRHHSSFSTRCSLILSLMIMLNTGCCYYVSLAWDDHDQEAWEHEAPGSLLVVRFN